MRAHNITMIIDSVHYMNMKHDQRNGSRKLATETLHQQILRILHNLCYKFLMKLSHVWHSVMVVLKL
jgi:hypothetical protein